MELIRKRKNPVEAARRCGLPAAVKVEACQDFRTARVQRAAAPTRRAFIPRHRSDLTLHRKAMRPNRFLKKAVRAPRLPAVTIPSCEAARPERNSMVLTHSCKATGRPRRVKPTLWPGKALRSKV